MTAARVATCQHRPVPMTPVLPPSGAAPHLRSTLSRKSPIRHVGAFYLFKDRGRDSRGLVIRNVACLCV